MFFALRRLNVPAQCLRYKDIKKTTTTTTATAEETNEQTNKKHFTDVCAHVFQAPTLTHVLAGERTRERAALPRW